MNSENYRYYVAAPAVLPLLERSLRSQKYFNHNMAPVMAKYLAQGQGEA